MLSAGLSGGNWSLDVPDFQSGPTSPGVGLTIITIMPGKNADERIDRAKAQSQRLQEYGVHVPGVTGYEQHAGIEAISIPRSISDLVSAIARSNGLISRRSASL
jgi:LDH2 family malate/lactate/ureidoglycolate dehydrogenase